MPGVPAIPKEFARQLLGHEAAGKSNSSENSTAFSVCDKLRQPLAKLMGVEGYTALLSRALALGGAEVSWLRSLHINPDGSLAGLDKAHAKPGAVAETTEGEVVLVGHLLGLLVTLVGPALTIQLLHDVWPKWTITLFEEEKAR